MVRGPSIVRSGPSKDLKSITSVGVNSVRGNDPNPCNFRPKLKTMRHWTTSFPVVKIQKLV
jgi:hypothetical protein